VTGRRHTSGALVRVGSATARHGANGYARCHTTSATTASSPHDASAHRQPTTSASGAVRVVVRTLPPLSAAVYRPVTRGTCPGKSRPITTGTATLPAVMATPIRTVPDECGAEPVGRPQQRAGQDRHQRRCDHPPVPRRPSSTAMNGVPARSRGPGCR
jgi:hypothetical protein